MEMETKVCNRCKQEKSFSDYYKNVKNIRSICKECEKARKRADYQKNKEHIRKQQKEYYDANNAKILTQKKEYYVKNKVKIIRKFKIRYNTDPQFKLYTCIRRRTRDFLHTGMKYMDMICCSQQYLIQWFEFNFELDSHWNMTWENLGKIWQIDHVYALSKLKLLPIGQHNKYYSWKNLRPVDRKYNTRKSNTIKIMDLILIEIRIKMFQKINPIINKVVNTFVYNGVTYIDNINDDQYEELNDIILSDTNLLNTDISPIFENK